MEEDALQVVSDVKDLFLRQLLTFQSVLTTDSLADFAEYCGELGPSVSSDELLQLCDKI